MWESLHNSEALDNITAAAYALAALSLLVWLAIFVRRRADLVRQKRDVIVEAELTESLLALAAQKNPDCMPFGRLPRWRQEVLLRVLTSLLQQTRGAGRNRLITLARAMGVDDVLHETLNRRRPGDRLDAAAVLGYFDDTRSVSALLAALKDSDAAVRFVAARSLLHLPCTELTLPAFLQALGFSAADPSIALEEIFQHLPSRWHAAAVAMIDSSREPNWRRMVAIALARAKTPGVFPAIARLLHDPDSKLRAAGWIALAELDEAAADTVLPRGLADRVAEVRAQASRCAGRLRAISSLPQLTLMLQHDDDWRVRHQAAHALANLGPAGHRAIRESTSLRAKATPNLGLLVLREREAEGIHVS